MTNNRVSPVLSGKTTTLEDLPPELHLKTNNYLSTADTMMAFNGLNSRFNGVVNTTVSDRVNILTKQLEKQVKPKELEGVINELIKINNTLSPLQREQIGILLPKELNVDITTDVENNEMDKLILIMNNARGFLRNDGHKINITTLGRYNTDNVFYCGARKTKASMQHLATLGIKTELTISKVIGTLEDCTKNNISFREGIRSEANSISQKLEYLDTKTGQLIRPSINILPDYFVCANSDQINGLITFLETDKTELQNITNIPNKITLSFDFDSFESQDDVNNKIKKLFNGFENSNINHVELLTEPVYAFYAQNLAKICEQGLKFEGTCDVGHQKQGIFSIQTNKDSTKTIVFDIDFRFKDREYEDRTNEFLKLIQNTKVTNLVITQDRREMFKDPNNIIMQALKQRETPLKNLIVDGKSMMYMLENSSRSASSGYNPRK